jgi:hypothetical protein
MPRLKTGVPRRSAGETAGKMNWRSCPAKLQLAAQPSRAGVRGWSIAVFRNMRWFLAAWGMVVTRRILLVVHYLCHEIVHFSCMYEAGQAKLRPSSCRSNALKDLIVQGVVRWAAKLIAVEKRPHPQLRPDDLARRQWHRGRCFWRTFARPLLLLRQFRNYCGLIKIARCGFPWEKTTKRPVASV